MYKKQVFRINGMWINGGWLYVVAHKSANHIYGACNIKSERQSKLLKITEQ